MPEPPSTPREKEATPRLSRQPRPGTTAGGGQSALDWILANPGVEVVDAEVIQFVIPPGQQANFSDHLPVTAEDDTRRSSGDLGTLLLR